MAGHGVAQLPVRYYADALREGRLVRVRATPVLPNVQYFAVYRRHGAHALAAAVARIAKSQCDFGCATENRPI